MPDATVPPRYSRRLSDEISIAFHQACDQREIETAANLLDVLEFTINRAATLPTGADRRASRSYSAHGRESLADVS